MPPGRKGTQKSVLQQVQNGSKEKFKRKKTEEEKETKQSEVKGERTSKPCFLKDTNICEEDKDPEGAESSAVKCSEGVVTLLGGDKLDNRVKWSNETVQRDSKIITKEFSKHKLYKPESYTCDVYKKNEEKNRYHDILCMDATRVVLKEREEGKNYIHASWITLPNGLKHICTQGPLAETIEDFWHMVFTEKSTCIVMLCSLVEGGNSKCERYYPKRGQTVGGGVYKIKFVSQKEDIAENITCYHYELSFRDVVQKIFHYQCSTWTDHLAPYDPAPAVKLLRHVRNECKDSPITVHCSAGIGRTSTFVGLELAAQRIKENCNYSLVDLMKELRSMRFHAIQGPFQYLFLHMGLLEYFAQEEIIKRTPVFKDYHKAYKKTLEKYEKRTAEKIEKNDSKKKKKTKKD